ncbi:ribonuclease P protein component [Stieleria sp. JC731]|uniref:ribonuclease P protein component n=1 Tax=Pirellulaceae TaxID=2691357 RepID=UPI001E4AD893|nr:ribonuclease P protein component [Stieleria sp. JC731]MCC9603961.1 ribonuclease P protein component [Stieleria sp. JC731]
MQPSTKATSKRLFPKSMRVVSGREFTLVLRRGACAADNCLVVFAVRQSAQAPSKRKSRIASVKKRLGITIPKKTGNAVVRNHWKRLIRESFRTQQERVPAGFDFVVRPKKGAVADWKTIQKSIPKLTQKAVRRLESSRR